MLQLTDLLYSSSSHPSSTIDLLQLFVLLFQQLEASDITVDLDNAEQQNELQMQERMQNYRLDTRDKQQRE